MARLTWQEAADKFRGGILQRADGVTEPVGTVITIDCSREFVQLQLQAATGERRDPLVVPAATHLSLDSLGILDFRLGNRAFEILPPGFNIWDLVS